MKSLTDCKLYTFVDTAYLQGRSVDRVARELCDGGADLIQLRAKQSSGEEVRRMAQLILPITRAEGVLLVINDHPKIAAETGADLCHLGQEDFFGRGREDSLPTRAPPAPIPISQVGLSTHSPEQARRALAVGPAYIAVGPVFATPTKPSAQPVTLEYVSWTARHVTIPWFAIGGINLRNLPEVLAAGARRICVVSGILCARDISAACRAFKDRL